MKRYEHKFGKNPAGALSTTSGYATETTNFGETAFGILNKSTRDENNFTTPEVVSSSTATLFSVGNGTDTENRKNIIELKADGTVFISGVGGYNGTNSEDSTSVSNEFQNIHKDIEGIGEDIDHIDNTIESIHVEQESDLVYTFLVDGENRGTINIPRDQFLKDVNYNAETNDLEFLFLLRDENNDPVEKPVKINMTDLEDIYTNGDGLNLENKQFSIKIDADTQPYIDVTSNGLKIVGINEALDTKVDWQENKTSIFLPANGSLTALRNDGQGGGVLICQRSYDNETTYVTEVGTTKNNLTLNSIERPKIDFADGTSQNIAYESEVKSLQDRMSTAEADIDNLEGRMDTAESDIDAIQSDLSDLIGDGEGSVQDQIKTALEDYLPLSGGTMTGNITFGSESEDYTGGIIISGKSDTDLVNAVGSTTTIDNIREGLATEDALNEYKTSNDEKIQSIEDKLAQEIEAGNTDKETIDNYTVNGHKISENPVLTKTDVGLDQVDNVQQIPMSMKGQAGGVAELDANGKVPSSQLNGQLAHVFGVDGVVANQAALPAEGVLVGDIYYTIEDPNFYNYNGTSWDAPMAPKDDTIYNFRNSDATGNTDRTNILYRWDGAALVEISESLALGESAGTAYEGNKGAANRAALDSLPGYLVSGVTKGSVTDKDINIHVKAATKYGLNYGSLAPANFTLEAATSTAAGVMSAQDKSNLDTLWGETRSAVGSNIYTGANYISKETNLTGAVLQLDEEIKATNDNLALEHANAEATYATKEELSSYMKKDTPLEELSDNHNPSKASIVFENGGTNNPAINVTSGPGGSQVLIDTNTIAIYDPDTQIELSAVIDSQNPNFLKYTSYSGSTYISSQGITLSNKTSNDLLHAAGGTISIDEIGTQLGESTLATKDELGNYLPLSGGIMTGGINFEGGGEFNTEDLPDGLSIVDEQGNIYPNGEGWTQDKGYTGIGISKDGHKFVMAIADNIQNKDADDLSINTRKAWSNALRQFNIPDLPNMQIEQAVQDFDSKSNTDAILAALATLSVSNETNNAAVVCRNYSKGVIGKEQWDLPASGILEIIYSSRSQIISLGNQIFGNESWGDLFNTADVWSSNEYNANSSLQANIWQMGFSRVSKINTYHVVPVFTGIATKPIITVQGKSDTDVLNANGGTVSIQDIISQVTVPTKVSELTNDSGYQTESQVAAKVSALVDSAPATLDTLNELAAALGDDPNFATTVTNKIAEKLDKNDAIRITKGNDAYNKWVDIESPLYNKYVRISSTGIVTLNTGGNENIAYFALHSDLANYLTKTTADSTYQPKGNYLTSVSWDQVGSKPSWIGSSKPSYTWDEIGSRPSFATVATSGSYNDLTNKPTIPAAYSLPTASSNTKGGILVGYSENGKNYPVELDNNGRAFVNVPWTDNNTTYGVATTSTNGLMSSSDKSKLDGIASGANKTTVDSTLSSSSTNPVQNKVINSALAGKANSSHTHTASQVSGLATVATSGSYNDLSNKPSIPQPTVKAASGTLTLWTGTESEYNAISSKDPNTLYFILES